MSPEFRSRTIHQHTHLFVARLHHLLVLIIPGIELRLLFAGGAGSQDLFCQNKRVLRVCTKKKKCCLGSFSAHAGGGLDRTSGGCIGSVASIGGDGRLGLAGGCPTGRSGVSTGRLGSGLLLLLLGRLELHHRLLLRQRCHIADVRGLLPEAGHLLRSELTSKIHGLLLRLLLLGEGETTCALLGGHLQLLKIELHVVVGIRKSGHGIALRGEVILLRLRLVLGVGHGTSKLWHAHHSLRRLLRSVQAWILHRRGGDRWGLARKGLKANGTGTSGSIVGHGHGRLLLQLLLLRERRRWHHGIIGRRNGRR